MTLYHAIGDALVTQDEIDFKQEPFVEFFEGKVDEINFQSGRLLRHVPSHTVSARTGDEVPFREIGMGKPLLAQIRHVYRGEHPLGRRPHKKEMLVTSAVK